MAIVTAQIINRYYENYKNTEITFSKEIIHTLKMDPRQVYIKCSGLQWPCIINSTSFSQAKIILGTKSGAYSVLSKKDVPPVSLRFCFYQPDGQLMSFFVTAKVALIEPYMNSSDLSIITIQYTQRPPDDLIMMIGNILDANFNAAKRKEERILVTQESMRKLGLQKKEIVIYIQNVPRHCILQDLSFGGVRIVLLGLAKFLINKEALIQLEFEEPHEIISIRGIIVRTDFIEGRKDIISASIKFAEDSISLAYKVHINKYIASSKRKELDNKFTAGELEDAQAVEEKLTVPAQQPAQQDSPEAGTV
ncbi:PilZN3 domain-containing protein [Treponema sp.]|uniref:PilZN3 domain-containing protein n=1 Tax=Treponema sp. TaxID=166 RepID=UPI003EFD1076